MIVNTTLSLCNIILSSISNIWWNKDIHVNGIGYVMMCVHPNLRTSSLSTLFFSILIWLGVAKWCGVSLVVAMGKNPTMGQELWQKAFCVKSSSIPKLKNYKMLKMLFKSYMNGCPLDLDHHILVQWSLSIEYFGMWRLGMCIGILFCLFVILSRGLWKSIWFVLLTRIIWMSYLWRIWHVFVSFVWTVVRMNAKMSNG
jgi:hypothetical protein